MKKELFNSLEASTRTNHPSPAFQAHKRTRYLSEIRGARQPAPSLPRRLPTKHARRPEGRKYPGRKPPPQHVRIAQALTRGDARAPAVNARRRRRRPPAARSAPQKRRPSYLRRVPHLRIAPRPAHERRRGQQWPWPFFGPARSAGAACTRSRCWRPPSAGLPYFADHREDARTRRRKALEGFSTSVPCEILDDTSIDSSEAPPQTLSNGDRNKLSRSSYDAILN